MTPNRVIHFEIHATEPEKLAEFYRQVFGWDIKEWGLPGVKPENRYWFVVTAPEGSKEPGINGGLLVRKGPAPKSGEPVSSFICTIHVPSVDEYLKKIEAAGGTMAVPKMPIPGLAWLAYGKDPEGNIFGIYEDDKNAK
ncbi:glyoxalase [Candidatus Collierbacteria bacterium RIFCSPHIGHO2_02_FULL_49_10]|uniref:Glyoxalase n=2 Tax=Candidatus Collieribacteriota TaxID=1752725 RepID=A0A1F5EUU5_9BACT|nr:MAG: glyoxalase [Candidatus Collierbacteria bacterium RIFCSPHIGHO2_02_FULL_49_10]OGD71486.1 MAG: glyoxalase [Candidatus Collierbacteria bacterium RIFCSPHIGHO2_01_FULL_50_25]